MLDRYLAGTATRLSPEAAVPVVSIDSNSQSDWLGGAGNVAANLAALGAKVRVFGVLGGVKGASKRPVDDGPGAEFRRCLHKVGIDDSGVFSDPRRVTTLKTRVIARHQQIVRIDHERRDPLSADAEEKLFRSMRRALPSQKALLLSDYAKGVLSDALTQRVLHACDQFKVPVFVKPNTSTHLRYNGAQVVVCNRSEAAAYLGRPLSTDESIEDAAKSLLSYFGCSAVVITLGDQGMTLFDESSQQHLHIPATNSEITYANRIGQPGVEQGATGRQVFDVTGAGDTVLSVLSLALAAGASLPDAAFLANTAAGVVVGKLGTATLTAAELSGALDDVRP